MPSDQKERFMRSMLLVAFVVLGFQCKADLLVGVARGMHVDSVGLIDTHIYAGFEFDSFGATIYHNSFDDLSLGVYYKINVRRNRVSLSTKLGLISGYSSEREYRGRTYYIDKRLFIGNMLLMVVPEIKYDLGDGHNVLVNMLGDSFNLGYEFRF